MGPAEIASPMAILGEDLSRVATFVKYRFFIYHLVGQRDRERRGTLAMLK